MLNQAQLIGRLGRDPEVRYTQDGICIANLAVATSESHKDKATGETKQATEWHRVVLFGRTAEIAREYLKKGGLVYLQGKIRTRKWKNQAGQDQNTTEIVAHEMLCSPGGQKPRRQALLPMPVATIPVQTGTVPSPTRMAAAVTHRCRRTRGLTPKTTTSLSLEGLPSNATGLGGTRCPFKTAR